MKPIIIGSGGVFFMVQYPYRKTKDLYVSAKGHPVFCSQCEAQFKVSEFLNHIRSHDKRKGEAPIISQKKDGKFYEVKFLRRATKCQKKPVS